MFPNFGGTSAAAPNVAGLVALIREVQPDASQAQIIGALETTAVPLNSSPGGWEPVGGHGLVDADAAVQTFVTPPTVHVKPVRPDPLTRPIDNLKIIFSQVVQGFDISDLTLTRDGGPNLLTGAQTLRSTDGGRTWLLRELRGITDAVGTYTLTLSNVFSGITNTSIFAHPLAEGTSETWERIAFPTIPTPPANLRAKVVGEGVVRLRWDDLSGNEDRFVVQRAEDEDFTQNVKSFNVPKDTTVFTDEVIIPVGKRVFYRVRALSDFSEFRESSNVVEVFLPGAGEVIVDNESSSGLLINGAWTAAAATQGTLGDSFLTDQNSAKGTKNVRYQPNIPRGGEYFVYARWARTATSATNVPIDVVYGPNGSIKKTITVDQRNEGGAGWVLLGKFSFDRGRSGFVRVRTDGTNGLVTIDAVRFQPATGAD